MAAGTLDACSHLGGLRTLSGKLGHTSLFLFPLSIHSRTPECGVALPTLRAALSQSVLSGKALGSLSKGFPFTHMYFFLLKIALSPL